MLTMILQLLLCGLKLCKFLSWHNVDSTAGTAAGHEVNHSLPPIAEIKNEWSYTSTPPSVTSKRG